MAGRTPTALAWAWGTALAAGLAGCGGGGGGAAAGTAGAGAIAGGETVAATGSADGASTAGTAVPAAPAAAPAPAPAPAPASPPAPMLDDCTLFPAQAVFNTRIDDTARFPALASSGSWIASVGASTPFRADWWLGTDPSRRDAYYGLPINKVDGSAATTDWASLLYDFNGSGTISAVGWPHESDCAVADGSGFGLTRGCSTVPVGQRRFPFPRSNLLNEGGTCNDPASCGDHHVLVVETGACRLWEGFSTYRLGGQWYTLSSAAWDLKSLALRPAGWTAADAAGLPITPFVVKAAEASSGEIRHALRVTFRDDVIANRFTWPARHAAGNAAGSIPFGSVLRLRADFVIPDSWTTQAKAIATAAKRYGLYVADIGADFYVQGEPDARWEENTFRQVATIPLSQMEFVDLGAVTSDPRFSNDSMAARWD